MRNFKLKIAGYNIGFEANPEGPELAPASRLLRYISNDIAYDIQITIHSGSFNLPAESERVFHAPFVEELDGVLIHSNPDFWSVWRHKSDLFITTTFPLSDSLKNAVLKFSLSEKEWDLWIESDENEIDPFEYPLEGLILYYLTVIKNDIMIHASGVNNAGEGLLFSGVSGKGKSTIAELWDNYGARIIHDDRLIIRKVDNGYRMFNTPVYNNDDPQESSLNRIFIIEHGNENKLIPLKEASAVSMVMANCIQHTWGSEMILQLLESISEMCRKIPTYRLLFSPGRDVIDHILKKYGQTGE
jgi:hypothetical protein